MDEAHVADAWNLCNGTSFEPKYSNSLHIDDVAVDFPDMPIIVAHPLLPWQDEALSVAMHKPQVHIGLYGWSPKYCPPQPVPCANSLLRDEVLFGFDFLVIIPERLMDDLYGLPIKDEVRLEILKDDAVRLFGPATQMPGNGT
jgi:predicted TIM-barrel fold metal-dependent hydrolase